MTIKQVLKLSSDKLKKVSDTPWLDAEILLGYTLKVDRAKLFACSNKELTKKQHWSFRKLVNRRLKHEPIAYITRHKEFYGLDFYVDKRVMIPRPETEILIDAVLEFIKPQAISHKPLAICDIGTGSGCIAIALAKKLIQSKLYSPMVDLTQRDTPKTRLRVQPLGCCIKLYAVDISDNILKVAKKNAKKHKVLNKITFLRGNLLEPVESRKINVIIANLPYLTTKQWLSTRPGIRKYEPREALDREKEGLDYIQKLLWQVSEAKPRTKVIILEIGGRRQANIIKKLAKNLWPKCKTKIKKDLKGLDRIIIISI